MFNARTADYTQLQGTPSPHPLTHARVISSFLPLSLSCLTQPSVETAVESGTENEAKTEGNAGTEDDTIEIQLQRLVPGELATHTPILHPPPPTAVANNCP